MLKLNPIFAALWNDRTHIAKKMSKPCPAKILCTNSHNFIWSRILRINERTNEKYGISEISFLRAVKGNRMTELKN
jgi:hypothetical protein